MRRIVVLGGEGFFGSAAVTRLGAGNVTTVVASRRAGAEVRVDAEDREGLRRELRPDDVVLDAAGPFQRRTTTLLETALSLKFDVVDLSDSLDYAEKVRARAADIEERGIRYLTSCSSVSAVSAALVAWSLVHNPVRVDVAVAAASGASAQRGSARSLLASVGQTVRVRRGSELRRVRGFRDGCDYVLAGRKRRAYLMESSDAVLLPAIWPGLADVGFYIDSRVFGLNAALRIASWLPPARWFLSAFSGIGLELARAIGPRDGGLAVHVTGAGGESKTVTVYAPQNAHLIAIVPALLAVRALAEDRFEPTGFVLPHRQVEPKALVAALKDLGMQVTVS